jgi:hypothetical protein
VLDRYFSQFVFAGYIRRGNLVAYRFAGSVLGRQSISCDQIWGTVVLDALPMWLTLPPGMVHLRFLHHCAGEQQNPSSLVICDNITPMKPKKKRPTRSGMSFFPGNNTAIRGSLNLSMENVLQNEHISKFRFCRVRSDCTLSSFHCGCPTYLSFPRVFLLSLL